jgi:hypothetical protein
MRNITKLLVTASIGAAAAGYAASAAADVYVGIGWPGAIIAPPPVAYVAPPPYYPPPVYAAPGGYYGGGYYFRPEWQRRWHEWHEREEWREHRGHDEWREHRGRDRGW